MIQIMDRETFESLVGEALDSLPEEFAKQLDNVEVVVEPWPTMEDLRSVRAHPGTTLLGLYRGIAKTKRTNYGLVLPDKISIFAGPILRMTGGDVDATRAQVRKTVLHEIGHHFGMSEEEIRNAQK